MTFDGHVQRNDSFVVQYQYLSTTITNNRSTHNTIENIDMKITFQFLFDPRLMRMDDERKNSIGNEEESCLVDGLNTAE